MKRFPNQAHPVFADPDVKRVEVVFDDRRHATKNMSFLQAKRVEAVGGAAAGVQEDINRASFVPHRADHWSQWLASSKRKRQLLNILSALMPSLVGPPHLRGRPKISGGWGLPRGGV